MSYLKLLNARRSSGRQPTMKPVRLTAQQKARAAQGQCIQCGTRAPSRNSYICDTCQAEDTLEDIRQELNTLRRKILNQANE